VWWWPVCQQAGRWMAAQQAGGQWPGRAMAWHASGRQPGRPLGWRPGRSVGHWAVVGWVWQPPVLSVYCGVEKPSMT
jgi:hypothetical protein